MLSTQMRILRVFGLPAADLRAALRAVEAEGCSGLRLLERDGEFAVCVTVNAPNQAMADAYCEKWVQKLRARLGDTVYADGETGLAQATLDVLLQKRRLLVAADETTGRLIGARLQPLEHSEAAYDFGTQTWADRETARKLVTPAALLEKFPGDVVQAAAGRAQLALAFGGADYAVVYMPATVGQAPFALLCDKKGAVATAVSPDHSDAAIANSLLDMVRRRALGLKPLPSAITFRPGHDRPLLIVSPEGQPRTVPTTGRFTPRRAKTAAPAPTSESAPTGTITFEAPRKAAAPVSQPAADPAKTAQPAQPTVGDTPVPEAVLQNLGFNTDKEQNPLDFTTAGPEAAAASRHLRSQKGATRTIHIPESAREQASAQPEKQPAPSILDDDIPDFSAGLDPKAIAEAMAADEQQPPRSTEELQQAASRMFDKVETSAPEADTAQKRSRPDASALKNRSLAMIEKSQRRRRRGAILTLLCVVLVLCLGAGGLWYFFRNDLGVRPAPKGYGTATFDNTAEKYLANGMRQLDGVSAYLALPGMNGQFVYAKDRQDAHSQAENDASIFVTDDWLGSATPSNTVIEWGGSLAELENLDSIQKNGGFTLYVPGTAYRCKVVAVYYQDPNEEGGFNPADYTDLSNYYDYLNFSLNIGTRSLYDSTAASADGESYLTLVGDSSTDGVRLCVTGRLVHDDEDPALTATISENEDALLTGIQYEAEGKSAPDRTTLMSSQMERYTNLTGLRAGTGNSGTQNSSTADSSNTALDDSLASLAQQTQDLIASADDLLAGLTDIAGQAGAAETDINQGAEGTLPEQTVTIDSITSGSSSSTDGGEGGDGASSDSSSSSGSEGSSGSTASGTINVTMNGTAQTMDLVTCLAMVAQNELGSNAPAEAYKAQCVATHSWILSQSGYPSVAGTTPGSAALSAAQEVANILVTYNGQVCFTPYFASASTGTASAADVWGNARPWLVAVDSPYDQSTATNWNTNGYNTGCARFSRQTLQDRIKEKMGVDLSNVDPNNWFTILSKNEYGWVTQMQIGPNASGNDTCSGRWFREVLTAGCSVDGRSLRSQCFTVTYDAGLDCFIFDVYGYGHGCGMSQWGAIGYANNGWSYQQILQHYYPGTTLTTIG